MFITIEDETGVCNLVILPSLYEKQRRIIFTARMIGINGKIQREGEVAHVVVYRLFDLSANLAGIGNVEAFPLSAAIGDEVAHGEGRINELSPCSP